jgi:hypothetical protein
MNYSNCRHFKWASVNTKDNINTSNCFVSLLVLLAYFWCSNFNLKVNPNSCQKSNQHFSSPSNRGKRPLVLEKLPPGASVLHALSGPNAQSTLTRCVVLQPLVTLTVWFKPLVVRLAETQVGAGAANDGGTMPTSEREVAAVPIAANRIRCVTFAIVLFMIYLLWDLRIERMKTICIILLVQ